jgi:hypothetical protein
MVWLEYFRLAVGEVKMETLCDCGEGNSSFSLQI